MKTKIFNIKNPKKSLGKMIYMPQRRMVRVAIVKSKTMSVKMARNRAVYKTKITITISPKMTIKVAAILFTIHSHHPVCFHLSSKDSTVNLKTILIIFSNGTIKFCLNCRVTQSLKGSFNVCNKIMATS